MSLSDRDMSLADTDMSLSDTDISLADTAAPTRVSKIHKVVTNGVPVAPFELKLSQNESYGLQEPF